ncbi:MAG: NADP-dependent oxidoreductase [Gammaproteobacteria bacterium]|nr:NADP-dependent oxidoreductase [Gammaproteobacteria bacterium]
MAEVVNRKVVLAKRPDGMPTLDCFEVVEEQLGDPQAGQALIDVEHLSIDAFIRTTLDADEGLHGSLPERATVMALGVGRVRSSGDDSLSQGDVVFGPMGAQTHMLAPAAMFKKLDVSDAPARAHLGVLGLTTGLTSYVGMVTVGGVGEGDTVVVSAAAGAVGSVACEIGRILGARVIGIAGGADKVAYLENELGIAAGIDYKNEDVAERLAELAPDGVNLFFDNVGGELLDTVLDKIAPEARVVICGAISQYQHLGDVRGPSLYLRLAERNASMRGFTVDYHAGAHAEAIERLSAWLQSGEFHVREHIVEGIENFPDALLMLFNGGHTGKLMVTP